MKLYQINVEANYGSTGKIAEALGKAIQEDGGHAYLAHGRKHRASQLETYEVGNTLDYAVHFAKTRLSDQHGLASKNATKALTKHITAVNPDLIHLHNIHGYYLHYPTLFNFLKTLKKPVVWTLHDCWSFTGHCTHFEQHDCHKWMTQCNHCPATKEYPSSFGIDNSDNNFKLKKQVFTNLPNLHLVPVSKWLANYVSQSFLQEYPINVITNGIDLNTFNTIKEIKSDIKRSNYLAVASVWDTNKGFNDLLKIANLLQPHEQLTMVGLNKKQVQHLPPNIIGIERTSNLQELVKLYSNSDCFLNLSYADSYPTTIMEAMACGLPVITYETGGCVEMVKSSLGAIVPQGDYNAALDKARHLIMSYNKHERTNNSRNHALLYFDQREQMASYKELYKKLLQN